MAAPFQRRCAKCNGVFERLPGPLRGRSAHARYCSLSCRVTAEREARGLDSVRCANCSGELPAAGTCHATAPRLALGTAVKGRRRRADSRYCSGRCRVAAHRAREAVAA